jgi:hypothetical protein
MADRLPIVSIAGEKKELPASDTIAQSKINSLVGDLALKAPLASPVFTGDVNFDTDTLVVDSVNDRVGIGTASPASSLNVIGGQCILGGSVAYVANVGSVHGPDGTDKVLVGYLVSATNEACVFAHNSALNAWAPLSLNGSVVKIRYNETEKVRIDSDGLKFNGDTAAANALDDYEEGTWTPSLGGTATYTNRAGHYTKIGDMCHVAFDMVVATIGTGDIFTVAGLPFTASSAIGFAGACSAGSVGFFSGLATSVSGFVVSIDSGYTNCAIRSMVGNVASAQNNAIFGDGARIVGSAVYKVA